MLLWNVQVLSCSFLSALVLVYMTPRHDPQRKILLRWWRYDGVHIRFLVSWNSCWQIWSIVKQYLRSNFILFCYPHPFSFASVHLAFHCFELDSSSVLWILMSWVRNKNEDSPLLWLKRSKYVGLNVDRERDAISAPIGFLNYASNFRNDEPPECVNQKQRKLDF